MMTLPFGCAAPDAYTPNNNELNINTFSHQPIQEPHLSAIQRGIEQVCQDTGYCFQLGATGDSELRFVPSNDPHADFYTSHQTDSGRIHLIRLSKNWLMFDQTIALEGLERVSAHEFGHAAGLEHTCNRNDYMYRPDLC